MDQELRNLIEDNNRLLQKNLELTERNTKNIKKIQGHMRRMFITKVVYWAVIIFVTFGAVYAATPYVNTAVEKYNTISEQINSTQEAISNPTSLLKDVNLIDKLLGSE
ncbi:MAG: hypothetical protein ACPGTS_01910 [Minisyncoccia bacterium]